MKRIVEVDLDLDTSAVRRYVDNAGIALCLESFGAGPKHLLFLHGWISARRMWYDVLPFLDPNAFTVHLLDFRGCGLSDRTPEGHRLEGYASDVRAAVEAIGRPLAIVGHSMGGKLAQYVAATEPSSLIERLVLVAPGIARGSMRVNERHRARTQLTFGSRSRIEGFLRGASVREVPAASLERIVDDALVASHQSWFEWYDHGRTVDFSEKIKNITLPVKVVGGELDMLVPPVPLRTHVVEAIAGATLVQIPGCGHNLPIEAPAEVAQVIEDFV